MKLLGLMVGAVAIATALTGCVSTGSDGPAADTANDSATTGTAGTTETTASDAIATPLLEAHNRYRLEVGVPPLTWSEDLAIASQSWADRLATTNTFNHSDGSGYGENLWQGTAGAFSLTEMVEAWGDEQEFFIANAAFPNVSTTGNWADVGHYTQIVWRDTTEVGCGLATANGNDVLVCRYSPPGNYQGQMPF